MAEPDAPPSPARFTVPPTAYLWLSLLLATFALRPFLEPSARLAPARTETQTATVFEKTVQAEYQTRVAFGVSAYEGLSPGVAASRKKALGDAIRQYRSLLGKTSSPNLPRRLLVLLHAAESPFEERLVSESLVPALRSAGTSRAEIDAETALWRDLYGKRQVSPDRAPDEERRIRGMRLGFLEDRALQDLYAASGDRARADRYRERLTSAAGRFLSRIVPMLLLLALTFFAGLIFLIVFLVTVVDKRWQRVARVATRPQTLGWGDLLDAFVFYLFLVRGVGFFVSLVVAPRSVTTTREALLLSATVQIGTGLAALGYLWAWARRQGVTLADIGLTSRGALLANVGYGMAAYAATLPAVLLLRKVSELIFRNIPNTTPNPIMPLITSERDLTGRLVIFVMVALAAPLFEEIFFRGALFGGLRARYPWVISAVISSALFAVVHPAQDWLPIFGLGFGLATMREMRQSLVPCITAHLLQNTATFLLISSLFGD